MFKSESPVSFKELWRQVGDTPLLEITYRYRIGPEQRVYLKDERQNKLTGSVKDRMALYILEQAYKEDLISPGYTIVEASSGNTGIAFARLGQLLGHPVKIFMPDWLSQERRELLGNYGADLVLVSHEQGGFIGSIEKTRLNGHNELVFLPRQFENCFNTETHERTTGPEIDRQLIKQGIRPAAFVAGVGTGGTVMGVGRYLKALYPQLKVHPLEPAESPTLSTGRKIGSHRIQGISDEFIPPIMDLKVLDEVIAVPDGDAIMMAQQLAKELELKVGISSGANLLGAIKVQQGLPPGSAVISLLPDGAERYFSTGLFRKEPVKDHYWSPDVRLLECRTLKAYKDF